MCKEILWPKYTWPSGHMDKCYPYKDKKNVQERSRYLMESHFSDSKKTNQGFNTILYSFWWEKRERLFF